MSISPNPRIGNMNVATACKAILYLYLIGFAFFVFMLTIPYWIPGAYLMAQVGPFKKILGKYQPHVCSIGICMYSGFLFATVAALIGIHKRNPHPLRPMRFIAIWAGSLNLACLGFLTHEAYYGHLVNAFSYISSSMLGVAINAFAFVVFTKQYRFLKQEKQTTSEVQTTHQVDAVHVVPLTTDV